MSGGWGRRHVGLFAAMGGGFAVIALLLAVTGRLDAAAVAWLSALLCALPVPVAAQQAHAAARDDAVAALVRAVVCKDAYTGEHTERVARYSTYIGEELGLSRRRLRRLRQAASLHDVGKLTVPNELLNKPGPLTKDEYALVHRHESVGVDLVGSIDGLRCLAAVAWAEAVIAVADAYDAMTSTRAYRRALRQEVAFDELRARAGTQFEPACVEALIAAVQRRGERHGLGFERSNVIYAVEPPVVGVMTCGH